MVAQVTDSAFEEEVIKSSIPVIVDFWAEWCGPCKMIAPILEEVASQMQGKVKIFKMNVDENPNTPSGFGIRGIPTLMLFKDGALVDTKVGVVQKPALIEWIENNI